MNFAAHKELKTKEKPKTTFSKPVSASVPPRSVTPTTPKKQKIKDDQCRCTTCTIDKPCPDRLRAGQDKNMAPPDNSMMSSPSNSSKIKPSKIPKDYGSNCTKPDCKCTHCKGRKVPEKPKKEKPKPKEKIEPPPEEIKDPYPKCGCGTEKTPSVGAKEMPSVIGPKAEEMISVTGFKGEMSSGMGPTQTEMSAIRRKSAMEPASSKKSKNNADALNCTEQVMQFMKEVCSCASKTDNDNFNDTDNDEKLMNGGGNDEKIYTSDNESVFNVCSSAQKKVEMMSDTFSETDSFSSTKQDPSCIIKIQSYGNRPKLLVDMPMVFRACRKVRCCRHFHIDGPPIITEYETQCTCAKLNKLKPIMTAMETLVGHHTDRRPNTRFRGWLNNVDKVQTHVELRPPIPPKECLIDDASGLPVLDYQLINKYLHKSKIMNRAILLQALRWVSIHILYNVAKHFT